MCNARASSSWAAQVYGPWPSVEGTALFAWLRGYATHSDTLIAVSWKKVHKIDPFNLRLTAQAPVFMPTDPQKAHNHPSRPVLQAGDCAEEVKQAAQWWSLKMRQHDLAGAEVHAFEAAVYNGLLSKCRGHWYLSDPLRGSGHRSLANDLSTDPVFLAAAAEARIRDIGSRLPKAIMWVNPRSVKVQLESAYHPEIIYSARAASENVDYAASDEDAVQSI